MIRKYGIFIILLYVGGGGAFFVYVSLDTNFRFVRTS